YAVPPRSVESSGILCSRGNHFAVLIKSNWLSEMPVCSVPQVFQVCVVVGASRHGLCCFICSTVTRLGWTDTKVVQTKLSVTVFSYELMAVGGSRFYRQVAQSSQDFTIAGFTCCVLCQCSGLNKHCTS